MLSGCAPKKSFCFKHTLSYISDTYCNSSVLGRPFERTRWGMLATAGLKVEGKPSPISAFSGQKTTHTASVATNTASHSTMSPSFEHFALEHHQGHHLQTQTPKYQNASTSIHRTSSSSTAMTHVSPSPQPNTLPYPTSGTAMFQIRKLAVRILHNHHQ